MKGGVVVSGGWCQIVSKSRGDKTEWPRSSEWSSHKDTTTMRRSIRRDDPPLHGKNVPFVDTTHHRYRSSGRNWKHEEEEEEEPSPSSPPPPPPFVPPSAPDSWSVRLFGGRPATIRQHQTNEDSRDTQKMFSFPKSEADASTSYTHQRDDDQLPLSIPQNENNEGGEGPQISCDEGKATASTDYLCPYEQEQDCQHFPPPSVQLLGGEKRFRPASLSSLSRLSNETRQIPLDEREVKMKYEENHSSPQNSPQPSKKRIQYCSSTDRVDAPLDSPSFKPLFVLSDALAYVAYGHTGRCIEINEEEEEGKTAARGFRIVVDPLGADSMWSTHSPHDLKDYLAEINSGEVTDCDDISVEVIYAEGLLTEDVSHASAVTEFFGFSKLAAGESIDLISSPLVVDSRLQDSELEKSATHISNLSHKPYGRVEGSVEIYSLSNDDDKVEEEPLSEEQRTTHPTHASADAEALTLSLVSVPSDLSTPLTVKEQEQLPSVHENQRDGTSFSYNEERSSFHPSMRVESPSHQDVNPSQRNSSTGLSLDEAPLAKNRRELHVDENQSALSGSNVHLLTSQPQTLYPSDPRAFAPSRPASLSYCTTTQHEAGGRAPPSVVLFKEVETQTSEDYSRSPALASIDYGVEAKRNTPPVVNVSDYCPYPPYASSLYPPALYHPTSWWTPTTTHHPSRGKLHSPGRLYDNNNSGTSRYQHRRHSNSMKNAPQHVHPHYGLQQYSQYHRGGFRNPPSQKYSNSSPSSHTTTLPPQQPYVSHFSTIDPCATDSISYNTNSSSPSYSQNTSWWQLPQNLTPANSDPPRPPSSISSQRFSHRGSTRVPLDYNNHRSSYPHTTHHHHLYHPPAPLPHPPTTFWGDESGSGGGEWWYSNGGIRHHVHTPLPPHSIPPELQAHYCRHYNAAAPQMTTPTANKTEYEKVHADLGKYYSYHHEEEYTTDTMPSYPSSYMNVRADTFNPNNTRMMMTAQNHSTIIDNTPEYPVPPPCPVAAYSSGELYDPSSEVAAAFPPPGDTSTATHQPPPGMIPSVQPFWEVPPASIQHSAPPQYWGGPPSKRPYFPPQRVHLPPRENMPLTAAHMNSSISSPTAMRTTPYSYSGGELEEVSARQSGKDSGAAWESFRGGPTLQVTPPRTRADGAPFFCTNSVMGVTRQVEGFHPGPIPSAETKKETEEKRIGMPVPPQGFAPGRAGVYG